MIIFNTKTVSIHCDSFYRCGSVGVNVSMYVLIQLGVCGNVGAYVCINIGVCVNVGVGVLVLM